MRNNHHTELHDQIIDYSSEGLIEVDGDGMIYRINATAKKILLLDNDFELPHDEGIIENGDIVVYLTNRLGVDDDINPHSFEHLSYFEKLNYNTPFCIIGTYSDEKKSRIKPIIPVIVLRENQFDYDVNYNGVHIVVHADLSKRKFIITVDDVSYCLNYVYAVGHTVIVEPKSNRVKFYQGRGFTIRNESAGALLAKKTFMEKHTTVNISPVVNTNIFDLIFDFDLKAVMDQCDKEKIEDQYILLNYLPILFSLFKKSTHTEDGKPLFVLRIRDLDNYYNLIQSHDGVFKLFNDLRANKKSDNTIPIESFVGSTRVMISLKKYAYKAAKSNSNVLLLGESGTGKSKLAKLIHLSSKRADKPFVHVNCASIPYSLVESQLFGYEEGSFTGAIKGGQKGYFESAQDGTIFLDEIGELSIDMQTKLLKVLQERNFYRIGGNKEIRMNARIITATNKDLELLVREKVFREDLYYRLYVIPIEIPPLRNRLEDINELSWHLLPKICSELDIDHRFITLKTIDKLLTYDYPGNVRELENIIERAINKCEGIVLNPEDIILPADKQMLTENNEYIEEDESVLTTIDITTLAGSLKDQLKACESIIIANALKEHSNDKKKTMAALKIKKSSFYNKTAKY